MVSFRLLFTALVSAICCFASEDELIIHHINVEQGDSTLILGPEDPSGNRIAVLIDAGGMPSQSGVDGGREVLRVLNYYGLTVIDHFIASHYDADHIAGIAARRNHGTGFVFGSDNSPGSPGDDDGDGEGDWIGGNLGFDPDLDELGTGDDIIVHAFVDRGDSAPPTTQAYEKYLDIAIGSSARTSIDTQTEVDSFQIDLGGGAVMTCLSGSGFVRGGTQQVADVDTENEKSLSFLVQYGDFDYFAGGDTIGRDAGAEDAKVEAEIAAFLRSQNETVEVYHANHHGADNGSTTEFLDAMEPTVVVVSAGDGNTHSHPNAFALNRMAEIESVKEIVLTNKGETETIHLTGTAMLKMSIIDGDVIVSSDGNGFRVFDLIEYSTN